MLIKLTKRVPVGGNWQGSETVHEVSPEEAEALIRLGHALPHIDKTKSKKKGKRDD